MLLRVPVDVLGRIDAAAEREGISRNDILLRPWLEDGDFEGLTGVIVASGRRAGKAEAARSSLASAEERVGARPVVDVGDVYDVNRPRPGALLKGNPLGHKRAPGRVKPK